MAIKLAVFDVDGTLLRGVTACQVIARRLGKYERMCELERVTGREGVIAERKEMARWYIDAGQAEVEAALEGLQWAPGAFEGMKMLQDAGMEIALASVTWSFAVRHVAQRLETSEFLASGLDFGSGAIDHVWGRDKAEFLHCLCRRCSWQLSEAAAVGYTSGDFDMLELAGLGVFVGAHPPAIPGILHMPAVDIRDIARAIIEHSRV